MAGLGLGNLSAGVARNFIGGGNAVIDTGAQLITGAATLQAITAGLDMAKGQNPQARYRNNGPKNSQP